MNIELFGLMLILKVSFIGIVFGIIVGFLIVILLVIVLVKKVFGVFLLSVICGNLMFKEILISGKVSKIVNVGSFKIDVFMGINYVFLRKKFFIFMIFLFVISIVLFLGFSVFIDFMY